jgi:RNA polymerase sigma-70 factor, ECF subfamily
MITGHHRRDAKLMQLVAAGNREAQEAVLRRLRHRLHVVSSAVLGHAQDAEDATQAALIQILRRASTYRGESTLEAWSTRIGAREAVRIAQERRLRTARTGTELTDEEMPESGPAELATEIPRKVRDYLTDLPETLRNALVLRHVVGYTVPEMAEMLAISPNTIKERLSRARAEVRRMIRRDMLRAPLEEIASPVPTSEKANGS